MMGGDPLWLNKAIAEIERKQTLMAMFGAVTMAQNPFDKQTICLSLPGVTMGAMPAASGGRAAKLDDAAQAAAETEQASGPYRMAEHLVYDDIIDPAELRNRILDGLAMLATR